MTLDAAALLQFLGPQLARFLELSRSFSACLSHFLAWNDLKAGLPGGVGVQGWLRPLQETWAFLRLWGLGRVGQRASGEDTGVPGIQAEALCSFVLPHPGSPRAV